MSEREGGGKRKREVKEVGMMGFDCYDVLSLSRSATSSDVSRAYRRLALKFHPDKDGSDEAAVKFLEVAKAYDILSERTCGGDDVIRVACVCVKLCVELLLCEHTVLPLCEELWDRHT